MFRSHPGGWSAARQAVFVLLPLVIGAGLLTAAGNNRTTGMSRLEATQSSVSPLVDDPLVAPRAAEPPAVPAGATAPGVDAPAPEATAESPPTTGVVAIAAASPVPVAAPAAGTGDAGASAVVAADAASPASATREASSPPTTSTPTTQTTTTSTTTSTTTTTTTTPAPAKRARFPQAEAEVVPLTNADRSAAGLGTLSRNACLDAAASGFAEQMARNGVLAHNSGAGAAVAGCRSNPTWGDNVGMSSACDTALLEREWMASPSHRRNILNEAVTLVGVGAWTDEKGTCWVQVLFSS